MKKALLLCASHNDLGLIRSLRKLGFYIIATGNLPGLPGEKYVDRYIQQDYSDRHAVLELARREKVDAICQCCNDFGVYTASFVAEQLELPGYDSYATTLLLHNKDQFKKFAYENHLPCVESFAFTAPEAALEFCRSARFPLIVKPTDASAGNGISKISSMEEAERAVLNAFSVSRGKKIVLERYIQGTQHGFCTFLVHQKVIAYCSNNEYSFLNPYRVEIDTWPADQDAAVRNTLIDAIEKTAGLLDLKDGIFHLQYILENGKPYIIEVMRRVLGNMYGIPAQMVSGFDWDYWETRAKCGLSCRHAPSALVQEGFFAYKTVLAPRNGTVRSIRIPDEYRHYVWDSFLLRQQGDVITRYQSEPVGFLFMMFSSPEKMKDLLINRYRNDMVDVVG